MNTVQVLLLVASGAGAFYAASDWSRSNAATDADDGIVAPAPRPPASAPAPAAVAAADPFAQRVRTIPGGEAGAFGTLSFVPPPPPPPPVVAPPPPPPPPQPSAPPLPFTFVGMVERGAATPQAYIAKGDTLLIVAAGDVIDNKTYRVDALLPASVVFTYLPLGKQQTLNAPGAGP